MKLNSKRPYAEVERRAGANSLQQAHRPEPPFSYAHGYGRAAADELEATPMNLKPILYAEDEDNDVIFMQHACQKAGLLNPLIIVGDGLQAIEYLEGTGKYADRQQHPLPCLVLLDLKL